MMRLAPAPVHAGAIGVSVGSHREWGYFGTYVDDLQEFRLAILDLDNAYLAQAVAVRGKGKSALDTLISLGGQDGFTDFVTILPSLLDGVDQDLQSVISPHAEAVVVLVVLLLVGLGEAPVLLGLARHEIDHGPNPLGGLLGKVQAVFRCAG